MDPILYPYINKIKTDLIKKKKTDDKALLLLSHSLLIADNEKFKDRAYLNDYLVEGLSKDSHKIYHLVDPNANENSYTMSLDMDLRKKNMAYNTSEKIIILLFKRLFSIRLIEKEGDSLIFSNPALFNLEKIIKSVENLANHIISSAIDIRPKKTNSKYYMQIGSLGISQISYPVVSNSSEIYSIIFTSIKPGPDSFSISYKCGTDVLDLYKEARSKISKIDSLVKENNIDLSLVDLIKEYGDLKNDLASMKKNYIKNYIDENIKLRNYGGLCLVSHIIKEDIGQDGLDILLEMMPGDIIVIVYENKGQGYFLIWNKTELGLSSIIDEIEKIYPIFIENSSGRKIKGKIDKRYKERFISTFKDFVERKTKQ